MTRVGVGADTALSGVMAATTAAANYVFRIVVLAALTSPEEAGRYQLLLAWLSMGSGLADFGLSASLMPRLAVARGLDSPALRASVVIRLVSVTIVGAGVSAYFLANGQPELVLPFVITFLGCFFSARLLGARNTLDLLWRMKGRSWVAGSFSTLDSVIAVVTVAVVASFTRLDVFTLSIIWSLTSLPGFIVGLVPLLPEIRRAEMFHRRIPRRYYRGLIAASLPVGLTLFIGQVSGQLETLVLNGSATLVEVGHYGVATALLSGFLFLPAVIGSGLSPVVAQIVRGARADVPLGWFSSVATRLVGLVAIGLNGVAIIFADVILRLFPEAYAASGYIVRLYAIVSALIFLVILYDGFLVAIESRRRLLVGALGGLVAATVLEVLLVGPYGIEGLLVGKIVAVAGVLAWQTSSFPASMAGGIRSALARLAVPTAVFAGAYLLTASLPLAARGAITIAATLAAAALARTITAEEIRRVRSLRLS